MTNEMLVKEIMLGKYEDTKKAFEVIERYSLLENASFERCLKNEFIYRLNKSNINEMDGKKYISIAAILFKYVQLCRKKINKCKIN